MNLRDFHRFVSPIALRVRSRPACMRFGRHAAHALALLAVVPTLATALTVAPTGELAARRYNATTAVLPDGRILVAGGLGSPTTSSAIEIYDPARGAFTGAGLLQLTEPRQDAVAVTLPTGKVLIAGGREAVGNASSLRTAELFDPVTLQSSTTSAMGVRRQWATATLLADGRVLVAGGFDGGDGGGVGGDPGAGTLASAEIYDPAAATFTATGSMGTRRQNASAALLADGNVLIVGGYDTTTGATHNTAEIYDPGTGQFSAASAMPGPGRQNATLTLLTDQRVLVAGGSTGTNAFTSSAVVFNPNNTWSTAGSMAVARAGAGAVLLPDGRVLVIGGQSAQFAATATIENFFPPTNSFSTEAPLATARTSASVSLMPNGRILVAGGYVPPPNINQGGTILASAEVLDQSVWTSAPTTGAMVSARAGASTGVLTNGRVLFAGGHNGSTVVASAEVYNEANGTFSAVGAMAQAREAAGSALFPDGSFYIFGGRSATGQPLASAERFDMQAQTFSTNPQPLWQARYAAGTAMLANGRLLIAGGRGASGPIARAEVFDSYTRTFTQTGPMITPRSDASTITLADGSVLVVGGRGAGSVLATAERYDPATREFVAVNGSLATARQRAAATLLPNGKVLIAGGYDSAGEVLGSAELFDPQCDSMPPSCSVFSGTASPMVNARGDAGITLLPGGVALLVGGIGNADVAQNTTEVFDPATSRFQSGPNMTSGRDRVNIALTTTGRVLVAGGRDPSQTTVASAETHLRGAFINLGSDPRPSFTVSPTALGLPGAFDINGFGLRGGNRFPNESVAGSEGSSGGSRSAPTNAPAVRLQRLDNQQVVHLTPDPSVPWSDLAYRTSVMNRHDAFDPASLMAGVYRVYVNANGVDSFARYLALSWVEDSIFAARFENGE
ncbi:MAG: hypothetical protein J0L88_02430 [Xanthomonadales bacterium]|nr:hypothetical protein [Xanthomonadales bacterium]